MRFYISQLQELIARRDLVPVMAFGILAVLVSMSITFYCDKDKMKIQNDLLIPRRINPRIPYIGHIMGFYNKSTSYFSHLGELYPLSPIYQLRIFSFTIYVITSLPLSASVHRQPSQFSMEPFGEHVVAAITGLSREGKTTMKHENVMGKLMVRLRVAIAPGKTMDRVKGSMVESISTSLKTLGRECFNNEKVSIDLFQWTRRSVILATTDSVFGSYNPFVEPGMIEDFESYERYGLPLLANVLPQFIARKGFLARERCVKHFEYYSQKLILDPPAGSNLLQEHNDVLLECGLTLEDTARLALAYSFAVTTNSISGAFWLILAIFSNRDLLKELRQELDPLVQIIARTDRAPSFQINAADLAKSAPLLNSVFHEVLRHRNNHPLTRFVNENSIISDGNDSYLIQRGSGNLIILCQSLLHQDTTIWGHNARGFDPYRFVDFFKNRETLQSGSFLGFGGGNHVCPGRQFAACEALTFACACLLRFEISPENATEQWVEPGRDHGAFFTSLLPPSDRVPVTIRERAGWEGEWQIKLDPNDVRFKLASG